MKILIISAGRYPVPAVKGGAVSTLVQNLASGNSANKEAELYIVSSYDEKAKEKAAEYNNSTFIYIKTPKILKTLENLAYKVISKLMPHKNWIGVKSVLSFPWFVLKSREVLKKGNYDYVVMENTARLFWGVKPRLIKKKYDGKLIYHLHNEPKNIGGCSEEINSCKYILCVSEYVKQAITNGKGALWIEDTDKVKVLKNCIDTDMFAPVQSKEVTAFKEDVGISDTDRVIGFAGRIDEEKGLNEVLEALKIVKNNHIKLLVVGSSFYGMDVKLPFEKEVLKKAEEMKDKICFTGFLPYEKMPLFYNTAEVCVLPSMWNEPAGLTMIESLACGTPVITTNSGGIPEYMDEGACVMLDRNDNLVINIAKSVDDLLSDPDKTAAIGKHGREHVVKNFSSADYFDGLITILKEDNNT